jgi:glutamate dehydrogenase
MPTCWRACSRTPSRASSRGEVESDDFNRLVLRAGLAADDIVVLRAYAKYLKQIGFALSQGAIEATLATHPRIARMLVALFRLRFDPSAHDERGEVAQVHAIEQALEKVGNLSEDRVLRQLLALIQATLRTNLWRTGVGHSGAPGPRRSFLSLKFDSARVPGLPEPKPLLRDLRLLAALRGHPPARRPVARGGLRWSDRPEDFRTEVLGLVKAQMVKNTVIVPVGSKGGFVLKKAPPASDRDAYLKEGIACYQDYLRGLLDITDNLVGTTVVPPPGVVRVDGDDPYLVVGRRQGHGDVLRPCQRGQQGVRPLARRRLRLRRQRRLRPQGDGHHGARRVGRASSASSASRAATSRARRSRWSASATCRATCSATACCCRGRPACSRAFDHRHVFLDPDPDAAASFAERERLFKLPRSSWADYDTTLISAGGGVWARSEKSIPLSAAVRAALGIAAERLAPAELLSALLKAPVDLLYNGGIGTYVKASTETHAEVGDRANDGLRVNGRDLRCKVVGEGGNLGLTQRGRVEAALNGVSINTDAIDNSAGVDTSDHEVNIKILLGLAVAAGEISEQERNAVLAQMTDDVAALVLRDNYFPVAGAVGRGQDRRPADRPGSTLHALPREGGAAEPADRIPADRRRDRRAQGARHRPDVARARRPARVLQDVAVRRDRRLRPARGPVARHRAGALLPGQAAQRVRRPHRAPSAAPRDRRHARAQQHGQPRRRDLRAPPGRDDRRNAGRRWCAPTWRRARSWARRAVAAGRGARQQGARRGAVGDADRGGRLTARATTWFLRSPRLAEPMEQTFSAFIAGGARRCASGWRARRRVAEGGHLDRGGRAGAAGASQSPAPRACTTRSTSPRSPRRAAQRRESRRRCTARWRPARLARLRRRSTRCPPTATGRAWPRARSPTTWPAAARITQAVMARRRRPRRVLAAWEAANAHALERAQRLLADLGDGKSADLAMLSVGLRELRNLA